MKKANAYTHAAAPIDDLRFVVVTKQDGILEIHGYEPQLGMALQHAEGVAKGAGRNEVFVLQAVKRVTAVQRFDIETEDLKC